MEAGRSINTAAEGNQSGAVPKQDIGGFSVLRRPGFLEENTDDFSN